MPWWARVDVYEYFVSYDVNAETHKIRFTSEKYQLYKVGDKVDLLYSPHNHIVQNQRICGFSGMKA